MRYKINKVFQKIKNKDVKALLENFISLSTLQFINLILPLITLPYVLRIVGTELYGMIVMATTLLAYFNTFTDFSFNITATREVAKNRDSSRKLNYIYSKVMVTKSILLLISLFLFIGIVFTYQPFYRHKLIFLLTFPTLIGYLLSPDWFFQGIEKMRYITILNSGIKIFFTVGVFLFINESNDYWIYPALNSLGYLIAGLVAQYILLVKYNLKFSLPKIKLITKTLKGNLAVFIHQFVPNLYNNTTTLLLGVLVNSNVVGIYDAIKKITDLGVTIISIISRVFFPYLNRKHHAFKKYGQMMIVVGIAFCLFLNVFSPIILQYLNIYNPEARLVMLVLSFGPFFVSLNNIYGTNFFIIKGEDKLVMFNTLTASIIGFILAFPLIINYQLLGAALNLTISRAIMGIGMYYQYLRFKRNEVSYT